MVWLWQSRTLIYTAWAGWKQLVWHCAVWPVAQGKRGPQQRQPGFRAFGILPHFTVLLQPEQRVSSMHWLREKFQSWSKGSGVCSLIKVWPCRGRPDQSYLSAASSHSLSPTLSFSLSEQPFMSSASTIISRISLGMSAQNWLDALPCKHLKAQHLLLYVALAGKSNELTQLKPHTRLWLMNISAALASHDLTWLMWLKLDYFKTYYIHTYMHRYIDRHMHTSLKFCKFHDELLLAAHRRFFTHRKAVQT